MIAIGTRAHAAARRRSIPVDDTTFFKGEWMECGQDPTLSPTVFLAEQPANYKLMPHFHRQNQFQLFVAGSGSLGPQSADPVTVHYAGAYTGYGPVVSGPDGLQYFTIRPVFDTGFISATQAREKMVRGPKRHAQAALGPAWPPERLALLQQVQESFAIAPDHGLAVQHLRLPPDAAWPLQAVSGSVGQFVFVLSGSAGIAGQALAPWESAFVGAQDAAEARAGAGGAELVALHCPPTEPEYAPRA
jgi:hypothetical protein